MKVRDLPDRFHIHPLLWAMLLIGYLTGSFAELIIILTIVLIHEFGHLTMAFFFRWRIKKVMLWPFGGVMETDEYYTRPSLEEYLVLLMGPVQHLWMYLAIHLLSIWNVLPGHILEYAFMYNTYLLLFNLLPVWPLDGGKLLFLFVSTYVPFKKAYDHVMIFSFWMVIGLVLVTVIYHWSTLHTILLACFLLYEIRLEWKRKHFVYLRHLLARLQNNNLFKQQKSLVVSPYTTVSEAAKGFYKGRYHTIHIPVDVERKSFVALEETDCLHAIFTDQKPFLRLEQLAKKI